MFLNIQLAKKSVGSYICHDAEYASSHYLMVSISNAFSSIYYELKYELNC